MIIFRTNIMMTNYGPVPNENLIMTWTDVAIVHKFFSLLCSNSTEFYFSVPFIIFSSKNTCTGKKKVMKSMKEADLLHGLDNSARHFKKNVFVTRRNIIFFSAKLPNYCKLFNKINS